MLSINSLRLDTAMAFFHRSNAEGITVAVMPSATIKITPNLWGLARWGIIGDSPPEGNLKGAVSVANPLLGGLYAFKLPAGFKFALFFAATIPIGTGGYGDPATGAGDPNVTAATKDAVYARSGMDNIMFAPNDFSIAPGLDFAYIGHRFTVQVEMSVLQLMRVKNEATQPDQFRTNSSYGLHVGYYATKWLSVAAELRYQRFLSNPAAVVADATGTLRHNLSLALGPRFHVRTRHGWFRPSVAYAAGLLGVMARDSYHLLIVDLPMIF